MKTHVKYRMPWQQGKLDGMCGIYSIINSIKEMHKNNVGDDVAEYLFDRLCRHLDDKGVLCDVIVGGMILKTLTELMDLSFRYVEAECGITMRRRIAFRKTPSLDDYWLRITNHIETFGNGSVLIGLSGVHDHWSCIRDIKLKSILLADSSGLRRLHRSRCTTAEKKTRPHRLHATQTVLIEF